MRVPAAIAGQIEVRGIGIVTVEHSTEAPLTLVVDLLPPEACPRYPEGAEREAILLGHPIPRLALPIGAADGALRVRIALREWIDRTNGK